MKGKADKVNVAMIAIFILLIGITMVFLMMMMVNQGLSEECENYNESAKSLCEEMRSLLLGNESGSELWNFIHWR